MIEREESAVGRGRGDEIFGVVNRSVARGEAGGLEEQASLVVAIARGEREVFREIERPAVVSADGQRAGEGCGFFGLDLFIVIRVGPERRGLRRDKDGGSELVLRGGEAFVDLDAIARAAHEEVRHFDGEIRVAVGAFAEFGEGMDLAVDDADAFSKAGGWIDFPFAAHADHDTGVRGEDRPAAGAVVRAAEEFIGELAGRGVPLAESCGEEVVFRSPEIAVFGDRDALDVEQAVGLPFPEALASAFTADGGDGFAVEGEDLDLVIGLARRDVDFVRGRSDACNVP